MHQQQPRFGCFLTPSANDTGLVATARLAEQLGLDLIGIQDHPYQRRFHDTWTLLSFLAARTDRISLFPDVANLPLRPPAMLAKAAASLDVLSGGRCELGLGAGGFWEAIEAYGAERRAPGDALAALREAIEVIRLMWSPDGSARYAGEHYHLAGAKPGPAPAHAMGIWLGVLGPRALRLVGTHADGWVASLGFAPPESLAERHARIDDAAASVGRDPAGIRRIYNVGGDLELQEYVDLLCDLIANHRMDTIVLGVDGPDGPSVRLRWLAEEVIPRVRSSLG
ncbi:LLM class flavin-dependent oxidoreductase [Hoyosella sp. G463]|uniref:LLM class flavin-dependent oxidoreductase n=1 Tax=Lolliginicoccus lacisalsi TaxID=2742202 RepID=A0A927JEY5_9ACTN|nr:LLM class flavin-dependent oxidoreductase [Lolliginicoccus lacisalsi]MBD8507675.1 LLM class flavin-dependent oxidoreductase [Lolliginicoccus lacisalsi]